jgi:type II secretory pathway pseudopilin PulG
MALRRGGPTARSQAGFALIEVVVSALILIMTTGGVIKLLNSTGRAGAEERHKAQAYAIAQEDQARMRAMRIPALLTSVGTPRQVTVGGTVYTVTSSASFVNDTSGELGCGVASSSDDYLKIGSQVTWASQRPGSSARIYSILNPPGGSLDPSRGTLVFNATNAAGTPISAVGVSGTGAGTFSGSTDSKGCARFTDLPVGNYNLTTSLSGTYIDEDGNPPGSRTISVVGAGSNTISILYDKAGTLEAKFDVRTSPTATTTAATKAESIVLVNNGMQAQQKIVAASPVNTLQSTIKSTSLFPFSSAYAVYANSCTREIPEGDEAIGSALITPNGTTVATIHVPALFLTVKKSTVSSGIVAASGATVKADDTECAASLLRTYTTGSTGKPTEQMALPWGTYKICASAPVTRRVEFYNSTRRQWETREETDTFREYKTVEVESVAGTSTEISLSASDEEASC